MEMSTSKTVIFEEYDIKDTRKNNVFPNMCVFQEH